MATANGTSDAARYAANILASMQHNYHCRLKGVLNGKVSALGGIKKLWVEGVQGAKSRLFQPIAPTTALYTSVSNCKAVGSCSTWHGTYADLHD
jgi:hypothetical protein